jgi:hypothetical protein
MLDTSDIVDIVSPETLVQPHVTLALSQRLPWSGLAESRVGQVRPQLGYPGASG